MNKTIGVLMSEEEIIKLNVYQRLAEVRKQVKYLQKDSRGKQYSYVGSSAVLSSISAYIDLFRLQLKPEILSHEVTQTVDENNGKKRTTYFTEIEMLMTWVNIDSPDDKIECKWYAQGVDVAGEKGVGKALTYGEKYFLLKYFNIATDKDDPDQFQRNQEHSNASQATQSRPKQTSGTNTSKQPKNAYSGKEITPDDVDDMMIRVSTTYKITTEKIWDRVAMDLKIDSSQVLAQKPETLYKAIRGIGLRLSKERK